MNANIIDMEDPGLEPLKQDIEKAIYQLYKEHQPQLVESLRQAIESGHTPTMIEQSVAKMIPQDSPVRDHISLIASYLLRNRANKG